MTPKKGNYMNNATIVIIKLHKLFLLIDEPIIKSIKNAIIVPIVIYIAFEKLHYILYWYIFISIVYLFILKEKIENKKYFFIFLKYISIIFIYIFIIIITLGIS